MLLSNYQWVPVLFVSGACAESFWLLWFGSHRCYLWGNEIALGSIPVKLLYTDMNVAAPFVHLPHILPEMLLASLWSASFPCMCQSTFGSSGSFQHLFLKWAALEDSDFGALLRFYLLHWKMGAMPLSGWKGKILFVHYQRSHFLGLEAHYKKQPSTLYKCVSFAPVQFVPAAAPAIQIVLTFWLLLW